MQKNVFFKVDFANIELKTGQLIVLEAFNKQLARGTCAICSVGLNNFIICLVYKFTLCESVG